MNTLETLFSRKCVRKYTDNITAEELDTILTAANAAPVGLAQYGSLHLTVISNPEMLQKINAATAAISNRPNANPIYGAPTLILVSYVKPEPARENLTYSNAAIVAHNMALAATELGLGVCYIWGVPKALLSAPELMAELGVPEGHIPCCSITLGKTDYVYTRREIPDRISKNIID